MLFVPLVTCFFFLLEYWLLNLSGLMGIFFFFFEKDDQTFFKHDPCPRLTSLFLKKNSI
jgi:hypothetical protein